MTYIFSEVDRNNAIRMALGHALSQKGISKFSDYQIARQIGCGETTVRKYRTSAQKIGMYDRLPTFDGVQFIKVPENAQQYILFRALEHCDLEHGDPDYWLPDTKLIAEKIVSTIMGKPISSPEEVRFYETILDDLDARTEHLF